jgi:hypothetical protein
MSELRLSDDTGTPSPLAAVRLALAEPVPAREPIFKLVGAAALAALGALAFAAVVILGAPGGGGPTAP